MLETDECSVVTPNTGEIIYLFLLFYLLLSSPNVHSVVTELMGL